MLQAIYSCWELSEWLKESEGNVKLLILTQANGVGHFSPAPPRPLPVGKLLIVKIKLI